ncbi:LysR family transcriptional regulator [Loigolactobacillus bifermentans]|uniref:Malolactic regulator n=1 Tax=Loigolactobacillus bifermentans DSM 20003 TaxID=1423726 RepID=A0A0R1GQM0_9LACO|nr:LysR family transcriptional regulator [Loigolactobacillus bifermentans]KRK33714.1 malolactic regulator [Loigolactobacillus bifermentans DSM 20003]QGG60476.1 LysR family transcriptional regulator [Loigolactobacillus bifermentans]
MNTKDLAYFNDLISQKSFSKVAQNFGVSQPTITMAIKRLEADFGAPLVIRDRVHNAIHVTPSGEQLAVHAKVILRELDLAHQEIINLTQNRLVLGLPPIIENYYFPKVSARLAAAGLLDSLETVEGGSIWLRQAVRNGQVDMTLLGSVEPLAYQDLVAEEFDRQPFCIYVSAEHRLAQRKRIYFNELRGEDFVFFNSNFIHNTAFTQLTRRNHFQPKIVFRSNDMHVLMKLVAENIGVAFLTKIIDQPAENVVRLDLLDPEPPEFITSIVYRTNHLLTPQQAQLRQILHEALDQSKTNF